MKSTLPSWRELHRDDDPRVEAMIFARYRDAPPAEKLRMMEGLRRQAMALASSGLRIRHPMASDTEIRRRLADLLLGPELARKAYGPPPWEVAPVEHPVPRTAPGT